MKYSALKKDRNNLKKQLREAKLEHTELESSIQPMQEEFQQSYHDLTEVRAKHQIGDASKKDVDKATKRNQDIKAKLNEAKEQIDTKERVIDLLSEKVDEIERQFHSMAVNHYRDKVQPHFDKINEALATINEEIEKLNGYRKDFQKDGIRPGEILGNIEHGSEAVLTTKKLASIERKNYITQKEVSHG